MVVQNRHRLALCILAGLLTGLLWTASLPKIDVGWLAWICLVPTFWLLFSGQLTDRVSWIVGSVAGLSAGIGRVYWVSETLQNYGGLNAAFAYLTTFLLAAYVGLYPLIVFRLSQHLGLRHRRSLPWIVAAIWVLLDWVLSWLFTGFPWALIGYSQYRTPWILQIAAVTGVHGLSFILVAANAAIAQLLAGQRTAWSVFPLLLPVGVGLLLAHTIVDHTTGPSSLRIGIVQGSVEQSTKWKRVSLTETTGTHLRLARQLHQSGQHDLIVFPETAFPFRFDHPGYEIHQRWLRELARETQTPLLVGSLGSTSETGVAGLYNRAFLISTDGQITDYADKVHLVPFGEYLPLEWIFGYLDELTAESGAFDPGQMGHKVLRLPALEPMRFSVFICYESIFPGIARQQTLAGAQFLINTTNDGWFGTTSAPAQHLAMAVLRAVENGRPVVRAANTGISCFIDHRGVIYDPTELFEQTTISGTIEPRDATTPYTRFGDLIVLLSGLIIITAAVVAIRRQQSLTDAQIRTAQRELSTWARAPIPLPGRVVLLPGYGSDAGVYAPLLDALQKCFTYGEGDITAVDLRHDRTIDDLAAHVVDCQSNRQMADDPGPITIIGHSLGGLVGICAANQIGKSTRVIAIASPFGGTRWATLARWLGHECGKTLADLGAGSPATQVIDAILCRHPVDLTIRLTVDPFSSVAPAADLARSYAPAFLVYPRTRHTLVLQDPRVLRDVIAMLRGENCVHTTGHHSPE